MMQSKSTILSQKLPQPRLVIQPATWEEIPALEALIKLSAQELSKGYYNEAETQAAIESVFGVDTELVEDQTYFTVKQEGELLACGGWSQRKTLFGSDRYAARESGFLNPAIDAAKIRAFFVHPSAARRGIGSLLLTHCEAEARRAGFKRAEMMATLPGVPFYKARGYEAIEEFAQQSPGGVDIAFVKMGKSLSGLPQGE
jgi:GNAT superfamily N-acetyltransferase